MFRDTQNRPGKYAESWRAIGRVFRKHFLVSAHLDWFELDGREWGELKTREQAALLDVLAENPRCGPMFGLVPKAGVYANGVTVAEAYANESGGQPFRSVEQQQLVTSAPALKAPGNNVVSFADFKRNESGKIQRTARLSKNR